MAVDKENSKLGDIARLLFVWQNRLFRKRSFPVDIFGKKMEYILSAYHLYGIFGQNFPTNGTGLFLLKETEREWAVPFDILMNSGRARVKKQMVQ